MATMEVVQDVPGVKAIRLGWRDLVRLLWGEAIEIAEPQSITPAQRGPRIVLVYGKPRRRR